jgi:hypothetical protein
MISVSRKTEREKISKNKINHIVSEKCVATSQAMFDPENVVVCKVGIDLCE